MPLTFHEADALLGKRTEVRDAHDRYASLCSVTEAEATHVFALRESEPGAPSWEIHARLGQLQADGRRRAPGRRASDLLRRRAFQLPSETLQDLRRQVAGIVLMDRSRHRQGGVGRELAGADEREHQAEAPPAPDSALAARPAQSAVVGDAGPAGVVGDDQAQPVSEGQPVSLRLARRDELLQRRVDDLDPQTLAVALSDLLDLLQHRPHDVDTADVAGDPAEDAEVGRFHLPHVLPDRYTVRAHVEGKAVASATVLLEAGDRRELELRRESGAGLNPP